MKNLFIVASVIAMLPNVGFSANGLRYSYAKDMYGDLNVGYSTAPISDKEQYYVGGRGELSFMNWDNEYTGTEQGSESFSFKSVLGMNFFVGYKPSRLWRADIEIGYIGEYKESETEYRPGYIPEKTTFDFETYYATINGYYNFKYGLYIGAGLGGAMTNLSVDHTWFAKQNNKHVSPMVAVMFGWAYALDENTDFDARYRLSAFNGGDIKLGGVKTDMGYVMDNSLSVGIRCYF